MEINKDINGKESSKRVWAGRYLGLGLLMASIYFLAGIGLSVLGKEMLFTFPAEIWYGLLGLGGGLLGVTIFESKTR